MPQPAADPDHDPRPQAPVEPAPNECCDSGCPLCVYDLYAEEVARYRQALALWQQRHPDAE
ncbi:MAG TPA: oxidoreductase-like domain-containing protein [Stenotrophomonas sp.]|nr:oxidoreductase-like domain-containing protein [Stenotrophomonas sp.]